MFKGSMVALVTPMTKKQTLDLKALEKIIDFHLDNSTDALVLVGTTGEAAVLTAKEKDLIINRAVEQVNGKIPIVMGTGAQSTAQAVENTKHAGSLRVDGVLIMTPAYSKPPQRGLIAHYETIAKETSLPIILYNVPGRTACDLALESVITLSKQSNIVGIKEASGSLERAKKIIDACESDFHLFSGDDSLNFELLKLGAKGAISVTANIAPKQMHDICRLALAGRYTEAQVIDVALQLLHKELFIDSNPIPTKWLMSQMALCEPTLRLPLMALEKKDQEVVLSAFKQTVSLL